MPHEPQAHDDDAAEFPEDVAHRVLARAVELDAERASTLRIPQLREAAAEAGISSAAFEAALAEARGASREAVDVEPTVVGLLWNRLRARPTRDAGHGAASWFEAVVSNVVALATFWVMAGVAGRIAHSLALDWPAQHGAMIAASLLGIGIALRLRGRVTAVVLAGAAAAQMAEYPMHLLFGIQTVQGGPTKWALILAAFLGIAFGAMIRRTPRQTARMRRVFGAATADQEQETDRSDSRPLGSTRFGFSRDWQTRSPTTSRLHRVRTDFAPAPPRG